MLKITKKYIEGTREEIVDAIVDRTYVDCVHCIYIEGKMVRSSIHLQRKN